MYYTRFVRSRGWQFAGHTSLTAGVEAGIGDDRQMNLKLSQRIQALAPSATLTVTSRARALKEQGEDVISFAAGEPDFDTPQHIKDAAIEALNAGDTKYASPVSGKTPLREAVREYLKRYCGLDYGLSQITITAGAKEAIYQSFCTILDPGDEVIIPAPYWVSYPEQVKLAGGIPVCVHGPYGGVSKVGPDQLATAITPRTKMLVLNSPSNPAGIVYTRDELEALASVLRGTDVIVLSDELYHRLILDGDPQTSFAALSDMFERTITVNGLSKTYAMTGWRLGFAAGPDQIITGMARMQGQTTSGAVTFCQTAAIAALTGDQKCVDEMVAAYRARGRRMHELLSALPGVSCEPARGGFVCFPDVSGTFERLGVSDATQFAEMAIEQERVALVTGAAFGCPEHVRLTFATGMEQIEKGLARLARLLSV